MSEIEMYAITSSRDHDSWTNDRTLPLYQIGFKSEYELTDLNRKSSDSQICHGESNVLAYIIYVAPTPMKKMYVFVSETNAVTGDYI